jgi:hypothetical protein
MNMKHEGNQTMKKRDTYEAQINGRKVRVTVPENDESELFEAVREQLSPEAMASMVAHLQGARTNNQDVDRQVHWFTEELCKLLGGYEQQARLAEELGL